MAAQVQGQAPAQAGRTVQSIIQGARGKPVEAFMSGITGKLLEVETVRLDAIQAAYSTSTKLNALLNDQATFSESDTRLRAKIELLERLEPEFTSRSFGVQGGEPFCEPCGVEEVDEHIRTLNVWRGVLAKDTEEAGVVTGAVATVRDQITTLTRDIDALEKDIRASQSPSSLVAKITSILSTRGTTSDSSTSNPEAEPQDLVSRSVQIASGLGEVIGRIDMVKISEKERSLELKKIGLQESEALSADLTATLEALEAHIRNVSGCIQQKIDTIGNLPGTLLQGAKMELATVQKNLTSVGSGIDAENERLCRLAEREVEAVLTDLTTAAAKIAGKLNALKNSATIPDGVKHAG